jgi:rubrerythrin
MSNIFSGSEIVSFGIQIEKNGKDFYGTLAEKTGNPEVKGIFKLLADEEGKHIVMFQKILELSKEYEPSESYLGEYFDYMTALAGEYVFTQADKGEDVAGKTKNDKDAVNVGIKFEKESIVFYEQIKKAVPEQQVNIVEKLIDQENGHLFKLLKLRESI